MEEFHGRPGQRHLCRGAAGVVEAPRGTLFHHYVTDREGRIVKANLIVATQQNLARIQMSVERAAKALIKNGEADDGILNMIEMAFRAYDPCHGCGTHALPGEMPLIVRLYNAQRQLVQEVRRDPPPLESR
jgi:F420-non-reducing hydrogenase large subunit